MKLLNGVEVVGKQCRGPCGKLKPIDAFNLKGDARDGRQSYCRECLRQATGKSMRRLRALEATVKSKSRVRFDDWAAEWLKRNPERNP